MKWIEDRTENLISTGFARDYHMTGDLALDENGKMLALRVHLDSDNGAFFADAQPSKFKAGLFHIVTGSYDIPTAHVTADGYYTNKAPGGVAYRCSFRVTEASYLIERLVTNAAIELGIDQAEFRKKNFIQPEQFPYHSATGWVYDSGDYPKAMDVALDQLGYDELRKDVEARRKKGEVTGIGIASFTEVVGAGHGADFDILGLRMFDSAELRVHPTGKAILRMGTKSQGQGHETTFAQIVAEELGIPAPDVAVEEGDTDTAPYGLGTYASRSTPVAGAATAMVSRKLREKARKIAAHLLEAAEEDLEWERGKFFVKGSPDRAKTIQEIAFAAYTNLPEGMEAGLEGVHYYDPPNMTYPFGTYAVVVDVDKGTGQVKVQRMVAVDDCGVRINPMIVEGQIHGGLAEGFGIAFMELITFDDDGNCIGSNFMDYLLPTAWETPKFELGETVTPSPHHPLGAKGVGESPTVGSPAAYVNAVIDALSPYGVTNIDMPVTSDKVWAALRSQGSDRIADDVLDLLREYAADRHAVRAGDGRARASRRPRRGPGDKAVITADGRLRGWIGGSCSEPVVRREALRALAEGTPQLVTHRRRPTRSSRRRKRGELTVATTCPSGGSLDIFIEPRLPRPLLLVFGDSPVADDAGQARRAHRLSQPRR